MICIFVSLKIKRLFIYNVWDIYICIYDKCSCLEDENLYNFYLNIDCVG